MVMGEGIRLEKDGPVEWNGMERFKKISSILVYALMLIILIIIPFSSSSPYDQGVSVWCMTEYEEGGAPAVYASPECPLWALSAQSRQNQTVNRLFATLQGRREYQEDRIVCDLDIKVPLLGKIGLKEETVGVAAVFDGHGGNEASEMASTLFLDYFYLHAVFQSYKIMTQNKVVLPSSDYQSMKLEILKESLLKTIRDINLKFSQEAIKNKLSSGSTAVVVLLFDGQILVANVGDSKALLLSDKIQSGDSTVHLSATELTNDHHPERKDERARIEAAGGSVIFWGVPRVNGILAMSRSIGDVDLKRHGVIAEPEFTGWQRLTEDDRYLVVASDGIFESLAPKDVSDLIFKCVSHFEGSQESKHPSSYSSSSSMAEWITNTAYRKGSYDNLSVIVVPLR